MLVEQYYTEFEEATTIAMRLRLKEVFESMSRSQAVQIALNTDVDLMEIETIEFCC